MTDSGNSRPVVRATSPAGVLAVIPHLFGFVPHHSLVVLGAAPPAPEIRAGLRYDLPGTPDAGLAEEAIHHAATAMTRQHLTTVILAGYGPGHLVTPFADAATRILPGAGVTIHDILRTYEGRWWSYTCQNPTCCPPSGTPLATPAPLAAALAAAFTTPPLSRRDDAGADIAPVTGALAEELAAATRVARSIAEAITHRDGAAEAVTTGLAAIDAAIRIHRAGGAIDPRRCPWLTVLLAQIPVRDGAWARMDPAHHAAHQRLWAIVTRHAQPGYAAAPACLLALTAWQAGNGTLANLAVDRALADTPPATPSPCCSAKPFAPVCPPPRWSRRSQPIPAPPRRPRTAPAGHPPERGRPRNRPLAPRAPIRPESLPGTRAPSNGAGCAGAPPCPLENIPPGPGPASCTPGLLRLRAFLHRNTPRPAPPPAATTSEGSTT